MSLATKNNVSTGCFSCSAPLNVAMWYHVWKEEVVRESLTWRIYRYKIYLGLMYVADMLGHVLLNITFCGKQMVQMVASCKSSYAGRII
jgi:hypothetical protein